MLEKLYEFCAVGGQAEAIVFILSRDVNPDYARENDNISPLFEAARNGKIDSIKALLDNGASVNFHRKGHTGLIGAITSKNPEVVDVMLQYRADPKIPFERGARKATPRQYADATLKSQPDILAAVTALLDAALLKSE
jgi:ankyrin repeat protein